MEVSAIGVIYKITNIQNNKSYIGQTIRPPAQRFARHINDAIRGVLDTHLARAIKKYGSQNFIMEVIDEADSQEELNQKEQFWIFSLDTVKNGYNETYAPFKCGGNTYESKTEDELKIIKEKISNTKTYGQNPNARGVIMTNLETGEKLTFSSQQECADYLKLSSHMPISRRCRGYAKSPLFGIYEFEYYDE